MTQVAFGPHVENINVNHHADVRDSITHPEGCVTVLSLQMAQMYPYLRARFGSRLLIHIRMYAPNWYIWTPEIWAAECHVRLSAIPGLLDDPFAIITLGNEPDLQYEGHPDAATWDRPLLALETWDYIWSWFERAHMTFIGYTPHRRAALFTPPPAGGHEPWGYPPDWEFQLESFKALLAASDGICVHAYGNPDGSGSNPSNEGYWHGVRFCRPKGYRETVQGKAPINGRGDPGGVAIQYPNYPIFNAELGTWLHQAREPWAVERSMRMLHEMHAEYQQLSNYVGGTIFIFDSDGANQSNVLWGNDALIRRLPELHQYRAADWPFKGGTQVGYIEKYPADFEAWKAAGGVENNFKTHVLAIHPEIVPTAEDVKVVVGNAKAAATQAELVVSRFPFR